MYRNLYSLMYMFQNAYTYNTFTVKMMDIQLSRKRIRKENKSMMIIVEKTK